MTGGTLWTPAEDALLTELWQAGVTVPVIAEKIGRVRDGIRARARRLELGPPVNRVTVWSRPASVTRLIEEAQAEAGERAANYADAFSMSRTRMMGDTLEKERERNSRRVQADEYASLQKRRAYVDSLRVERTVCGFCGVRSDHGCKHQVAA